MKLHCSYYIFQNKLDYHAVVGYHAVTAVLCSKTYVVNEIMYFISFYKCQRSRSVSDSVPRPLGR